MLLYFSGYGAQQPDAEVDGLYQACCFAFGCGQYPELAAAFSAGVGLSLQGYLVPADFADDLPEDLIPESQPMLSTLHGSSHCDMTRTSPVRLSAAARRKLGWATYVT